MPNMTPGTDEATVHLVTGTAGTAHITSADDGAMHAATIGTMTMGVDAENKYAAGVTLLQNPDGTYPSLSVSNRTVTLSAGAIMLDGRYIRWNTPMAWDMPYPPSGTYQLYYAIAVKYERDASGIESAAITMVPIAEEAVGVLNFDTALAGYDNRITTASTTSTIRQIGQVQAMSSYVSAYIRARRMLPLDMVQGTLLVNGLSADERKAVPGYYGQRMIDTDGGVATEYVCKTFSPTATEWQWSKRASAMTKDEIVAMMTPALDASDTWSVTIDDAQIVGSRLFLDISFETLAPTDSGTRIYTLRSYGSLRPESDAKLYAPAVIAYAGTASGYVTTVDPTLATWRVEVDPNAGSYPDGVEICISPFLTKTNSDAATSGLGKGAKLHAQISWRLTTAYSLLD